MRNISPLHFPEGYHHPAGRQPVMARVRSFPPISHPSARVLLLGSMPGEASLEAGQYYAHPRNAFWPLMESLLGVQAGWPYERRIRGLMDRGLAVWDVLRACTRPGSLDSDIVASTMLANDFATFFGDHPDIRLIGFNGATAWQAYHRLVLPTLDTEHAGLRTVLLPSSSPAMAALNLAAKTEAWRDMLGLELARGRDNSPGSN